MKKAFTLSEILITLGIIGTVAALTLPAVILNYRKDKTVNQLKKIYTILNQAMRQAETDYGEFKNWDSVLEIGNEEYYKRYYEPYFKKAKLCNTMKDCGYKEGWKPFYYIDDSKSTLSVGDYPSAIIILLSDGTVLIDKVSTTNSQGKLQAAPNLILDINAGNKPNKFGIDVFRFYRYKNGVFPYRWDHDYSEINENCKTIGNYCAAKIFKDNWQIKDDYPFK